MTLGTTELDSQFVPATEYTPATGMFDTLKASFDNFRAVNLSTSKTNKYHEVMEAEADRLSKFDSNNSELYKRYATYDYRDIEKLEALYENNPSSVKGFVQTNPFNTDVLLVDDFLSMKKLGNAKPYEEINSEVIAQTKKTLQETQSKLDNSDHWLIEMLGSMGGAMTDPVTIATLPLGTFTAGGTVLANAGKSFIQEAGIEGLAQSQIAPEIYSFKKELGMKTSVAQEAATAVMSMATAGAFRATGSAIYDLSPLGRQALKVKDPELSADYEALVKGQPTESVAEHIENMQIVEAGGKVESIRTPNEAGAKLNSSKPIKEIDTDIPEVKAPEEDLEIVVGKDLDGTLETRSYKQLDDELTAQEDMLRKVELCLM